MMIRKNILSVSLYRHIHVSSNLKNVRVRFAPSPTGYIHLGGLRTALFNFLFAKANQGKFILRIEDTDKKRLVPGAAKQLETDLDWMGLTPDESPMKGGSYGPYTQSERLHLYSKFTEELVKNGFAYHCFCSDRRLEYIKKEALREGAIPRYDNRCRQLTNSQIEEKKRQGTHYCIRFKLTSLDESLTDVVYGDVDRNAVLHEGDPVIMKQDGYPTYHLANVVDDHLMEITHVLRGTEWLVSTPKHVLMYKAFSWKPPTFAHLPLILNADGTKLSKRQDDIRLDYFRSQGFYPEAIVGLLCLVGGGFSGIDLQQRLYPLLDLTKFFRLENIATHSGRLDMQRLEFFNKLALQNRINQPKEIEEMSSLLARLVVQSIPEDKLDKDMLDQTTLLKFLQWAATEGRIHKLDQMVEPSMKFLWCRQQNPITTKIDPNTARILISRIIEIMKMHKNMGQSEIINMLKAVATEHNVKVNEVMKLMRSSLTGLKEGPPVAEVIEIIGGDASISRLKTSMNLLV